MRWGRGCERVTTLSIAEAFRHFPYVPAPSDYLVVVYGAKCSGCGVEFDGSEGGALGGRLIEQWPILVHEDTVRMAMPHANGVCEGQVMLTGGQIIEVQPGMSEVVL